MQEVGNGFHSYSNHSHSSCETLSISLSHAHYDLHSPLPHWSACFPFLSWDCSTRDLPFLALVSFLHGVSFSHWKKQATSKWILLTPHSVLRFWSYTVAKRACSYHLNELLLDSQRLYMEFRFQCYMKRNDVSKKWIQNEFQPETTYTLSHDCPITAGTSPFQEFLWNDAQQTVQSQ